MRMTNPNMPRQPVVKGKGEGERALQEYLNDQKRRSMVDAGIAFNYDRKTNTYSGGTMQGKYTNIPRSVLKQIALNKGNASLDQYYSPKYPNMRSPSNPRPIEGPIRTQNSGSLGSGMGTPIPPKPGMSNPRIPSTMVDPGPRKPMVDGPLGPRNPNGPRKPMGSPTYNPEGRGVFNDSGMARQGMKKGGMAIKKKAGKISEYGGKEMYSSKKDMMKHEGMEGMKMEKSGGMKMRDGGMTARKGYADGGMPMVMKEGKKVPSFAADGKGKMAMGGMATKNKGAAMKHGGMAPKGRGMAIMIAIGKPKGRGKS